MPTTRLPLWEKYGFASAGQMYDAVMEVAWEENSSRLWVKIVHWCRGRGRSSAAERVVQFYREAGISVEAE